MFAQKVVACMLLAVIACAAATTGVRQCEGGKNIPTLVDDVQVTPCKKSPCQLKQGSTVFVNLKFTPDKDSKVVTTRVTADFGIGKLPFVGVDGQSVCNKLTTADGAPASCPIKAGETYIYKDSFPVYEFYPKIELNVQWALKNDNDKSMTCFELPAKITGNEKRKN